MTEQRSKEEHHRWSVCGLSQHEKLLNLSISKAKKILKIAKKLKKMSGKNCPESISDVESNPTDLGDMNEESDA